MSLRDHRSSSRRREKRSVSDDSDEEGRVLVRRRPASATDIRLPGYRQYSGNEKEQKKIHRKEKKLTRNTREERTLEYVMSSGQYRDGRPATRLAYQSDGEENYDSETGSESTMRRMKEEMRYYATQNNRAASDIDRRIVYYNARNHGRPMSDVGTQLVQYARQDSTRDQRRVGRPGSAYSEQVMRTRDGDRLVEVETREDGNKIYMNYRLKEEAKPPPAPVRHLRHVGVQMTTKYVAEQPPPVKTRNSGTQTPAPAPPPKPKPSPPIKREIIIPVTPPPPSPPPPLEVMEPVPAVTPKAKSVMVRVGGGWMKVEHHRNHHIPLKVYEHKRRTSVDDNKYLFIKSRFARKKKQVPIAYKMYRERLVRTN
ncbi:serine/arginine repetitive matrix protein 1-like [Argopecten irradians]|uniref:serine/arginine repetitive matrix protein 1-like n=1 Tax=Argopecten irradians TaxID=31199 RepID=UPI003719AC34